MPAKQKVTFQKALDVIESLPVYQQEDVIDIIQHRLMEQRREMLAEGVREAKKDYVRGEVRKGMVDDLMKELLK
ncbi:MAG: hypothetical protein HZB79_09245 [Deltaproteobacteria bacterium]|nr:hypothetical protein [Deltaproteobacteria bacterium]